MISQEMLDLLICPESQQPLNLAPPEILEKLNLAIRKGRLLNRAGQKVITPFESGLIREDGAGFYPIIDHIPVMLLDESISLDSLPK